MRLLFISIFISNLAFGQIDYHAYPQTISSKDSIVKVEWLTSSPRKCQLDFNHLVNFISTKNTPAFSSTVSVELHHNQNLVRSFTFPVGDHIANRIYTYKPINLREGDHVYLIFKLNSKSEGEEYVFNLYEDTRAPIKTVSVIKSTGERIVEVKQKTVTYKKLNDRHFKKMMRRPITQEM